MIFNIMSAVFLLHFLIPSTFNAETNDIIIASHNLHGFKSTSVYHKSCINDYAGIWFGQEHRLSNKQLPQLKQLNAQFIARSGTEDAVSSGVLRGRPFGGVSIAWLRDLYHVITPLTDYDHKRVVAVELTTTKENIILISVYMPFLDSRNRESCKADAMETISMIETIIHDHPQHFIVIGGDLNCELNGNSPFDEMWNNLAVSKQLTYCRQFFQSPGYTYHHESLGQKKMNDHFVISQELLNRSICSNFQIIEDGQNPSDHLPIIMSMRLEVQPQKEDENPPAKKETLNWSKVSESDKQRYHDSLNQMTCHEVPTCEMHCTSETCRSEMQHEYDFVIARIKMADKLLPRHKKGREKSWWSSELTQLKSQSVEIQRLWIAEGRPGHGLTHMERLRVRALYKKAIRKAQKEPNQVSWNSLHSAMEQCDSNKFWHSWKSLYNKKNNDFSPVVNGCTSKPAIADSFKKAFMRNSTPNSTSKVNELNVLFRNKYAEFCASHGTSCDCSDYRITLEVVIDAICAMHAGKCADEEGLTAEHFHNAPLTLLNRLTSLFNRMLVHAFVPQQFRFGFMIPIVKDAQGSHSDVGNYRGFTISPVISKIFEHILKIMFTDHISTSPYQFGFKKKRSTAHALHCLRETINYYVENGSRVFCSFLDASKAFDRLVHSGLFLKLLKCNVPRVFLEIIMTWHDGLACRVRWDDVYSDWFVISAGVRQGGVLSPDFYSIYVDELISILQKAGIGCYYRGMFAAAIFYADDTAVLAPSVKGLQKILTLCHEYCTKWDILRNAKKSTNMCFGKGSKPIFTTKINGVSIPWVAGVVESGSYGSATPRNGCTESRADTV